MQNLHTSFYLVMMIKKCAVTLIIVMVGPTPKIIITIIEN